MGPLEKRPKKALKQKANNYDTSRMAFNFSRRKLSVSQNFLRFSGSLSRLKFELKRIEKITFWNERLKRPNIFSNGEKNWWLEYFGRQKKDLACILHDWQKLTIQFLRAKGWSSVFWCTRRQPFWPFLGLEGQFCPAHFLLVQTCVARLHPPCYFRFRPSKVWCHFLSFFVHDLYLFVCPFFGNEERLGLSAVLESNTAWFFY